MGGGPNGGGGDLGGGGPLEATRLDAYPTGGDLGVDTAQDFLGLGGGRVVVGFSGRFGLVGQVAFQARNEGFLRLMGGAVQVVGAAAEADLLGG